MSETREPLCSCGRQAPELGCDLCAICRQEYEERQYERDREYIEFRQRTDPPPWGSGLDE